MIIIELFIIVVIAQKSIGVQDYSDSTAKTGRYLTSMCSCIILTHLIPLTCLSLSFFNDNY